MERSHDYLLNQQLDEIRQTVGRDLLITEEAAIREQLIQGSLNEEDRAMISRLEVMYPALKGRISTQEDLTRVLMDLRGEDD